MKVIDSLMKLLKNINYYWVKILIALQNKLKLKLKETKNGITQKSNLAYFCPM